MSRIRHRTVLGKQKIDSVRRPLRKLFQRTETTLHYMNYYVTLKYYSPEYFFLVRIYNTDELYELSYYIV